MSHITKVIGLKKFDGYGIVTVQLDDGAEAEVYIGGSCEVYFHHNKIKAFIKKAVHKSLENN